MADIFRHDFYICIDWRLATLAIALGAVVIWLLVRRRK
jgi:hypothetical protein